MGHHSGRGTAAAAMVHSVLADDDSYGVFGTSKHTDSYIRTNNRRVKKRIANNICNRVGLPGAGANRFRPTAGGVCP